MPNNLTEDEDFLANELVPVILKSLRKLYTIRELKRLCLKHTFADIRDDTGALADALTDKYLADAEMGNFTSMTPGLTDVRIVLHGQFQWKTKYFFVDVQCFIPEIAWI